VVCSVSRFPFVKINCVNIASFFVAQEFLRLERVHYRGSVVTTSVFFTDICTYPLALQLFPVSLWIHEYLLAAVMCFDHKRSECDAVWMYEGKAS
jgi:hypothetical protein